MPPNAIDRTNPKMNSSINDRRRDGNIIHTSKSSGHDFWNDRGRNGGMSAKKICEMSSKILQIFLG